MPAFSDSVAEYKHAIVHGLDSLPFPLPSPLACMVALLGLLVAVGWAVRALRSLSRRYAIRDSLMSPAERLFLTALDRAVGKRYRVVGKPRIADVLCATDGRPEQRYAKMRRMFGMHVDFALCEPRTLRVVCCIELDDRSHLRHDRRKRDAYLNGICRAAGLPLLRVPASNRYDSAKLQARIDEATVSKAARGYAVRPSLMTPAERLFLASLERAVGRQYRVMGKPRVADVLYAKGITSRQRYAKMRRMFGMHFDFALCDPGTLRVVCCIEFDDKNRRRRDRHKRDSYLEGICRAAGLPLLRVIASNRYSSSQLRARVVAAAGQAPVSVAKTRNSLPE